MSTRYALVVIGLLVAGGAKAQSPRVVVPINQDRLADGARRYSVLVTVGQSSFLAGLDTGSEGLRVLPGELKASDIKPTAERETTSFGSGAELAGLIAMGHIQIGGLEGDIRLEMIDHLGCVERKPNCAARKIALSDYEMMANSGATKGGFRAILGVALRPGRIDNPLKRLGVRRFIVELPGEDEKEGRLILNPSLADIEGFIPIPSYPRGPVQSRIPVDAVPGCLVAPARQTKICGALTLDTGLPTIHLDSPEPPGTIWPVGTKLKIILAGRVLAAEDIVIGTEATASHVTFQQVKTLPTTIIRAGVEPYLVYSVLYNFEAGDLAVRPRVAH